MQPRVLFLTSNGRGLGHLTRSMAMARRLPDGVDAVFLTLSQALPVVVDQGFLAEYVVSPSYSQIPPADWNEMYASRVRHMLDLYEPAVVVFDGTFPYGGLRLAIEREPGRGWVWSRRAMWRPDYRADALRMASMFDVVIEPGEFAADADRGPTVAVRHEAVQVDPVVLLDDGELLSREAAEAELGLAPGKTNVLVQLGAGNINDTSSETGMVVERLRHWPEGQIVVAESTIADRAVDLPEGVRRVRAYPVSRYARAFDLTVCATGYNTFHEAIAFGLPALYAPNTETLADDQLARALYGEKSGVGLTWQPKTAARLEQILGRLRDPQVRESMTVRIHRAGYRNGATAAAMIIAQMVQQNRGATS